MNLRKRVQKTAEDISHASQSVVTTSQFSTVAFVAIAAVAIVALGIALTTLARMEGES